MAEVIVFHHAQGLTPGVVAFAEELRRSGHTVHTPDAYAGRTFATVEEGVAHARSLGFANILEASLAVACALPAEVVYAGFSLGVMAAQQLAQTRPGALGALLFHSCLPVEEFGPAWPDGVQVQVHAMERDPWFVDEGDIEAARDLVASTGEAELFLYPGEEHLFADSSLPSYREGPASLLMSRVLAFLAVR